MIARLISAAAAGILSGFVVLAVAVTPAQASCAAGSPPRSAHAFVGVVVATSSAGRMATVRTEDGTTVEVRGTEAPGANQATSVDRTYRVGGRYEFHPTNNSAPWADNACTATRLLSVDPAADQATTEEAQANAWTDVSSVAGVLAGLLAAGCLVIALVAGHRRRRSNGRRSSVTPA
jgi:hypothetical protein